ncbi:hypothetical protein ACFQ58_08655 [Agromyces sp. NPDC056523]|uniref:hypothetical protein n=1 Tax=Agromyces sp. NPDC056523 TaxID=3345850 RepID=UPI003671DF3D
METFLEQSRTFMRAITESFHLINTSRAGVELLSSQVARIVNAGADDRVIEALFPMPNGTTGQNLRAHTLRPQAEKDRDLAEMWLFVVFARYESWAESLELEYGISNAKRGCQFPYLANGSPGFVEVFSVLTPDALMLDLYQTSVHVDRYWLPSDSDVRAALLLYRYFKEVRNSLVHSDGRAHQRLADASNDAQGALKNLQASTTLRPAAVPVLSLGDPIVIDLPLVRDTIALLQRLVFTIDARILLSTIGLDEFLRRWRHAYGPQPVKVNAKKLERPAWFDANVSHALAMPAPVVLGNPNGATWPAASRRALVDYGVPNWLIRRLL